MTSSSPSNRSAGSAKRGAGRKQSPSVAAGAARAAGERARRSTTPLLDLSEEAIEAAGDPHTPAIEAARTTTPAIAQALVPETGQATAPATPSATATAPVTATPVTSTPVSASPVTDPLPTESPRTTDARPTDALPTESPRPPKSRGRGAATSRSHLHVVRDKAPAGPGNHPSLPLLSDVAESAGGAVRRLSERLGITDAEAEEKLAGGIDFLRRRFSGDYTVDDFGFDADFAEHMIYPLLRPPFEKWFRVEVRGVENIPGTGGALVVGNHSGTVAIDSLMTQLAIFDHHPQHRHLRELGADLLFATPFLSDIARKSGATLATNADAERLLEDGHLVGVWPEGFKGIGKPFSERYKLQRFGRGGFVSTALKTRVPIIPCSIVGAEEIYPIIANIKPVARALNLPYFPLTATFPLLGPLGLVPLPSKWIIEFGPAIDTAGMGPEAAEDPVLVFDLTDRVRETIQQTLYALLLRRGSVFS